MPTNEHESILLILGFLRINNRRTPIIPMDIIHMIARFDLYCTMLEIQAAKICHEWRYLATFKHPGAPIDKGIEFLMEQYNKPIYNHIGHGNRNTTIASFLYDQRKAFSRESIGTYLIQHYKEILEDFLSCFDFKDKSIYCAFKEFSTVCGLPNFPPRLDEYLEMFAKEYFKQYGTNDDLTQDEVYIFALCLVLLSTNMCSYKRPLMSKLEWRNSFMQCCNFGTTAKRMIDEMCDNVFAQTEHIPAHNGLVILIECPR